MAGLLTCLKTLYAKTRQALRGLFHRSNGPVYDWLDATEITPPLLHTPPPSPGLFPQEKQQEQQPQKLSVKWATEAPACNCRFHDVECRYAVLWDEEHEVVVRYEAY